MAKEKIQPVRGMQDILPDEMRKYNRVTETASKVANLYGFEHMATPIMESIDVFERTLGDSSDVVNKEMYAFPDRKGRGLVLRPENTASVVRSFISNGLQESLPAKFFYSGPMFRYERPQKGRQRQFHQIGVEALGTNNSPIADVDVITCGYQFLKRLGLNKRFTLQLNTLGDSESRANYKDNLVKYLTKRKLELSSDSLERLQNNPLRILDSKDEKDREIIAEAPRLEASLNKDSRNRFETVKNILNHLDIKFELNSYLVRGLDYYCHTVFEFVTDRLGAQGTLLAGGRYDGLVRALGGSDIDGVGWAAGVERLALMPIRPIRNTPRIPLIVYDIEAEPHIYELIYFLRQKNIHLDYLYKGDMKKRMQHANNSKARFSLIVDRVLKLKNMRSGEEYDIHALCEKVPEELGKGTWIPKLAKAVREFYKL